MFRTPTLRKGDFVMRCTLNPPSTEHARFVSFRRNPMFHPFKDIVRATTFDSRHRSQGSHGESVAEAAGEGSSILHGLTARHSLKRKVSLCRAPI